MFDFIVVSLSFFLLLIIASSVYLISKRFKLPYTILLFLVGLLLVPLSNISFLSWINSFKLTPEILFFVFLPILVFESAYNINYKELLKNSKIIFSLSVVGLLISTFTIGFLLYFLFGFFGRPMPLGVTILFGALISATDPVAVIGLFKSIGAPRRLSLIFEGESLFNDGTSLAVFFIIIAILTKFGTGGHFDLGESLLEGTISFLSMFVGGVIFGAIVGSIFSKILGKIKNVETVEITLTMVLAHITFLLAESFHHFFPFEISGIIATAVAGIIAGNYGRHKITPRVEEYMDKFWEHFAWLANSLVFILMGLVLADINIIFLPFLPLIFIVIVVVIIARGISVYLPLGFLKKFKIEDPVPMNWQHLLAWGSLRGALALMMVLMIPDNLNLSGWNYEFTIKEFLTVIVIASVVFTLLVKALTMIPLIKFLKIDKIHSLEQFEYYEGVILAIFKVLEKLEKNYKLGYIIQDEYEELKYKYQKKLNEAVSGMEGLLKEDQNSDKLIQKAISLHALGIEKQYLKYLFSSNEIDENNYRILYSKIQRQKSRLESNQYQFRNVDEYGKDSKDIFEKFSESMFDKDSPTNRYIRNRARAIVLQKTICDLENLSKIDFHFDKKYFEDTITLYKNLMEIANSTNKDIFNEYKTTIMSLETVLSEKTLLRIQEGIIDDLFHKEIITPKLYHKFTEEIQEGFYKER